MRLEAQAKLGFYPTPPHIVKEILKKIVSVNNETAKVLDPCCGEGEVLKDIKEHFNNVTTYGIELDKERYKISLPKVDNMLNCNSLTEISITNHVFDILWENPPYDYDVKDNELTSERLEKKFLQAHMKYLKEDGGLLIYIIPLGILKKVSGILQKLKHLCVISFPENDYKVFKQIIVMGFTTKKITSELLLQNKMYLDKIINIDIEEGYKYLPNIYDFHTIYEIQGSNAEIKTWVTTHIDPDDAYEKIKSSNLYTIFHNITEVKEINMIQPLTELSNGHTGMLIAAGVIDGLIDNKKELIVIKGSVSSTLKVTEDTQERVVKRTQYQTKINAINLTTKQFIEVI